MYQIVDSLFLVKLKYITRVLFEKLALLEGIADLRLSVGDSGDGCGNILGLLCPQKELDLIFYQSIPKF